MSDLLTDRKDLGHLWLDYIRMLGHPQMSAHLGLMLIPEMLHGRGSCFVERIEKFVSKIG